MRDVPGQVPLFPNAGTLPAMPAEPVRAAEVSPPAEPAVLTPPCQICRHMDCPYRQRCMTQQEIGVNAKCLRAAGLYPKCIMHRDVPANWVVREDGQPNVYVCELCMIQLARAGPQAGRTAEELP